MLVTDLFHALEAVPQDKVWHPEGNVWIHTAIVTGDLILRLKGKDPIFFAAGMFHDTGKLTTTIVDGEKIASADHEKVSIEFWHTIGHECFPHFTSRELEVVEFIIKHHMRFKDRAEWNDKTMGRFMEDAGKVGRLILESAGYIFNMMKQFTISDQMTGTYGLLSRYKGKTGQEMLAHYEKVMQTGWIKSLRINQNKTHIRSRAKS